MQGFGGDLSKAYLRANMFAGEAVSNIRTVVAFCAEEKVTDLYARELVEPAKRSFSRGQIAGIFYGVSQFFIFSSYALALWYVAQVFTYLNYCWGFLWVGMQLVVQSEVLCILAPLHTATILGSG